MTRDIAVIGGGAAGLTAALAAAESLVSRGKTPSVLVLERMPRPGKKLLATGNGRCNLTNTGVSPEHYHGDAALAAPLLARCSPQSVTGAFLRHGLLCREESAGRVYPYNLQASAVLDVLLHHLERLGVEIRCGFETDRIVPPKARSAPFFVYAGEEAAAARRVVLAAGGMASPRLGSNGSGFSLLRALGHTVAPLRPALVPLTTEPARVRPLKGVRCRAAVSLLCGGMTLQREAGEVQFTDRALSGICVFDLSHRAGGLLAQDARPELSLDLMPEYGGKALFRLLRDTANALPEAPQAELLSGILNKRVGREVIRTALRGRDGRAGDLKNTELAELSRLIKDFRFPVLGLASWDSAQVTAGGVPLSETEPETLESRLQKGLYLAGELLHLDGACGGFNLHWAWASGGAAGRAAAESL